MSHAVHTGSMNFAGGLNIVTGIRSPQPEPCRAAAERWRSGDPENLHLRPAASLLLCYQPVHSFISQIVCGGLCWGITGVTGVHWSNPWGRDALVPLPSTTTEPPVKGTPLVSRDTPANTKPQGKITTSHPSKYPVAPQWNQLLDVFVKQNVTMRLSVISTD